MISSFVTSENFFVAGLKIKIASKNSVNSVKIKIKMSQDLEIKKMQLNKVAFFYVYKN